MPKFSQVVKEGNDKKNKGLKERIKEKGSGKFEKMIKEASSIKFKPKAQEEVDKIMKEHHEKLKKLWPLNKLPVKKPKEPKEPKPEKPLPAGSSVQ